MNVEETTVRETWAENQHQQVGPRLFFESHPLILRRSFLVSLTWVMEKGNEG